MKLPLGYAYAATYAGIRQVEKDDLALIVSGLPANGCWNSILPWKIIFVRLVRCLVGSANPLRLPALSPMM